MDVGSYPATGRGGDRLEDGGGEGDERTKRRRRNKRRRRLRSQVAKAAEVALKKQKEADKVALKKQKEVDRDYARLQIWWRCICGEWSLHVGSPLEMEKR
jgi:hypothetical protein